MPYQLIARSADVGFVTPRDAAHAAEIVMQIRTEQARAGRAAQTVHVFGDLVVFLDETKAAAAARKLRLDERAGAEYRGDALVFAGTAGGLADLLQDWQAAGLSGFRLRPGALPHDLTQLTERWSPSCSAVACSVPPTRRTRSGGCSAWAAPPTATPPPEGLRTGQP